MDPTGYKGHCALPSLVGCRQQLCELREEPGGRRVNHGKALQEQQGFIQCNLGSAGVCGNTGRSTKQTQ